MPGKLEGKVALVTGGSAGIGLATARELAGGGAHVYITGRRQRVAARASPITPSRQVATCDRLGR